MNEKETDALNIPALALEDFEVPEVEDTEIADESGGSTIFGIIGSGQGGSRIAQSFFEQGYRKAIALNTTDKDLKYIDLPESQKYLMDVESGGGAGKDMLIGAVAVEKHENEIKRLIERVIGSRVEHILIAIGAGGGTGAGSVERLVSIAKEHVAAHVRDKNGYKVDAGERVGVVCALPTAGEAESPIVCKNAKAVTKVLFEMAQKKEISPLIIIDNDRIDRMMGKTLTTKNYWPEVNKQIAALFHAFNLISSKPSEFVSFDPADYHSIMRCGGCCVMGVSNVREYENREKVISAIRNNIEKTLLAPGFDLKTAKYAGVIAVVGSKIATEVAGLQSTLNSAFDSFSELLSSGVNLHRGIYEGARDNLIVYTVVSGLDLCWRRIEELG